MKKIESITEEGKAVLKGHLALQLAFCDVDGEVLDKEGNDIGGELSEALDSYFVDTDIELVDVQKGITEVLKDFDVGLETLVDDDADDLISVSLAQDNGAIIMQFKLIFDINNILKTIEEGK